ncbi:hypothetical protein [Burkholderia reimsis]|uniref:hypothetical protein n=1 Tax=Burkholderia reimsis TaxID=2234132 RepID=UPI0014023D3F|nr:hypothetical protein [Burkholderia reimsis]
MPTATPCKSLSSFDPGERRRQATVIRIEATANRPLKASSRRHPTATVQELKERHENREQTISVYCYRVKQKLHQSGTTDIDYYGNDTRPRSSPPPARSKAALFGMEKKTCN